MDDVTLVKQFQNEPSQRKRIWNILFQRHYRAIFSRVLFRIDGVDNTNVWDSPQLTFATLSMHKALLTYNPDAGAKVLTWIINTIKMHMSFRFFSEEYGSGHLINALEFNDIVYETTDVEPVVEQSVQPLYEQLDARMRVDLLGLRNAEEALTAKARLGIDVNRAIHGTAVKQLTTTVAEVDQLLQTADETQLQAASSF